MDGTAAGLIPVSFLSVPVTVSERAARCRQSPCVDESMPQEELLLMVSVDRKLTTAVAGSVTVMWSLYCWLENREHLQTSPFTDSCSVHSAVSCVQNSGVRLSALCTDLGPR